MVQQEMTAMLVQPELEVRLEILEVRVTLVILVTMALTERLELVVVVVMAMRVIQVIPETLELVAVVAVVLVVEHLFLTPRIKVLRLTKMAILVALETPPRVVVLVVLEPVHNL